RSVPSQKNACGLVAVVICVSVASGTADDLRRSGFVGVQVVQVSGDVRTTLKLSSDIGVRVQALVDGGSAKAAGLHPNDVITQVGPRVVSGVSDFVQLVKRFRAGDVAVLTINRDRQVLTLQIPIRPRPIEAADGVNVRYDAVTVDGTLRRTIVTAPPSGGRHPAVLYLNGIGCFSQESLDISSHDAKLLYGLTRAGFVTMRV